MMQIRDVRWEDGGATFRHSVLVSNHPEALYSTIYTVVFAPGSQTFWMKTPDKDWQRVESAPLFGGIMKGTGSFFS